MLGRLADTIHAFPNQNDYSSKPNYPGIQPNSRQGYFSNSKLRRHHLKNITLSLDNSPKILVVT
jgi:hypothetical protein